MESTSNGNAQARCTTPVPQEGEANTIKSASTPQAAPAHTLAQRLGMLGSFAQQLQPRARLVARNDQDFQSELRLASILTIGKSDARTARAASHPLEEEDKCKKPAEPQSMSRCASDPGQVTPICKDQGQRHLGKTASNSSIDAFEWQDIELTGATVCNSDGPDSQTSEWEDVGPKVSTVCTASLVERGGGDIGHFQARVQPAAKMTVMQAAAADTAATRAKDRQAAANQAVAFVPEDSLQPGGRWLGTCSEALDWMLGPSGAKAPPQSAVHEKFYAHQLPPEGVEEMLSVFSEADT